ncbi:MAG: hypothetical protein JWR74_1965 [Polaromonas sp.]|nr:hypothetical protein [Polaromonas sp.]
MKPLLRLVAAALLSTASLLTAAQELDLNAMLGAGRQIARAVDQDQTATLWDAASPTARKLVSREQFIANVQAARRPLGAVLARNWAGMSQQRIDGTLQIPSGTYLSIEFDTAFAGNPKQRELVSLRLDEDKVWRFTGYSVR